MVKKTFRHGAALPEAVREQLRNYVTSVGEYEASQKIGVGSASLARGIAGLGLRRGTATAIEMKLEILAKAPIRAAK
jgi:hypothetical protein